MPGGSCVALTGNGVAATSPCGRPRAIPIGTRNGFGTRSTDAPTISRSRKMTRAPKLDVKRKAAAAVVPRVYSSSLVLQGASELTPEIADAPYEAGCDDALVSIRDGVLFAESDREAPHRPRPS